MGREGGVSGHYNKLHFDRFVIIEHQLNFRNIIFLNICDY